MMKIEVFNREKMLEESKQKVLYYTNEASSILGITTYTLRRAVAAGRIKSVRIGKHIRISSDEIQRLTMGSDILFSAEEASSLLNITIFKLRAFIKAGKINAFRLAKFGPFKITKNEIDRIHQEGIK